MLKDVIQSEWFAISGYAIGLLGLILSFVFYKKSKIDKKPCCINRTRNIVYEPQNLIKDLEITAKYRGVETTSLSYTKVAFWNVGKATIEEKDIPKNNPLRIEVEGQKIYACEIIYETHKANNFAIDWKKDENLIYLTFDYMDFGQGVIIKIVHSGNSNSYTSSIIQLKGSIKGVARIESPHPSFTSTNFLLDSKIFFEDSILI